MSATTNPGRPWNTRKGRKWVVVAFWGAETTVDFRSDEADAIAEYENADAQGADVFYAEIRRMRKHKAV